MKRSITRTLTGLLVVLFLATAVQAGDIYVDDDNTLGPWDGTPENPYQHIQDGVDAALPGDQVIVMPGEYSENVDLYWGISLLGSGADDTTITEPSERVYAIKAKGLNTISGFLLRPQEAQTGKGIYVEGHDLVVIQENVITNFDNGIYLYIGAEAEIANNRITYNERHGICYTNGMIFAFIHNNDISGNFGAGIYTCNVGNSAVVRSNEITFNEGTGVRCTSFFDLGTELDPGLNAIYNNGQNIRILSGTDIPAQYNWWGQEAVGKEEPAGFPDGVIYEPWLPGPPGGPSIAVYADQSSYQSGDTATIYFRFVNQEGQFILGFLMLRFRYGWIKKSPTFVPIILPPKFEYTIDYSFTIPEGGLIPYTIPVDVEACLIPIGKPSDCGKASFDITLK